MKQDITRRALLHGTGAGALAMLMRGLGHTQPAHALSSQRAVYHMTPPSDWLCDPQRPVVAGGATHLYYLHSDQNNGPGGWDHASTVDGVAFTHHGTVAPLEDGVPVWTGSLVVDTQNTAGFGTGAVVALATRPTDGIRRYQEQYLYWSTDGGVTFTRLDDPVIVNPDGRTASTPEEIDNAEWFRDPKIHWDSMRGEWVCVVGRARYATFYTSPNLHQWTMRQNFDYPNHALGGIECPDLFEMEADDGTRHWILGASMDAYGVGLPMTYAYWMGSWDGTSFIADDLDPQWLDWGWDWYGAVTWPSTAQPDTRRLAIGWMNNWKYAARDVPTDATDGYNGQNSIVRELRLERQPGGWCSLLSSPIASLGDHVTSITSIPDRTVDGSFVLPWTGRAYELEVDLAWGDAGNVGISVGRSADGARHTNIGKFGGELYVDRGPSDRAEYPLAPYSRAAAPIDPTARAVHLRIFVDTQSVEVFVNAGHTVLSQQVHFLETDTGISFYTDGGPADFTGVTIREFGTPI
ncbi:levanbiose-producing levanase [Agromyces rhizosphaerae]|uniref:Levanbiose-producing levanase n=1 Tax=Agromyces rhizosphaerae TaxID=88374 RepID=A0A9W6FP35_9MICO|nr:glycoside hydrolase family 32 protein [Agromyces rhizosphaerae]GLI27136.1 levanbiose-producing levanase [Agromyces rhizosphaerae]